MVAHGGRRVLVLLRVLGLALAWEYTPEWTASHSTDVDAVARTVARDVVDFYTTVGLPPRFESATANPCWRNGTSGALRCLPAFYIIGGYNCGARSLAQLLLRGVASVAQPRKPFTNHWTYTPTAAPFPSFVRGNMEGAVPAIEADGRRLSFSVNLDLLTFTWGESKRVHHAFHSAFSWCGKLCHREQLPAQFAERCKDRRHYKLDHCAEMAWRNDVATPPNAGGPVAAAAAAPPAELTLPRLMAFAHGSRLRVVALLRNPVDRLWAAYFSFGQYHLHYGDSEDGVRAYMEEQAGAFRACAARHGARACALKFEALSSAQQDLYYHCDQLIKGLYAPFVHDWLEAVGGRADAHFELSEDFFASRRAVLARVVAFTGLQATDAELDAMAAKPHRPPRKRSPGGQVRSWAMSSALRAEVEGFYRPFNEQLAQLLGDPRYARWPVYAPEAAPTSQHRSRLLAASSESQQQMAEMMAAAASGMNGRWTNHSTSRRHQRHPATTATA